MKSYVALSLGIAMLVSSFSETSIGGEAKPTQGPIYGYATGCEHGVFGGSSVISLLLYSTEEMATKSRSSVVRPDHFLTVDGGPGYQWARVHYSSVVRKICQKIRSTMGREIIAVARNNESVVTAVVIAGETLGSDAYYLRTPEDKKVMEATLAQYSKRIAEMTLLNAKNDAELDLIRFRIEKLESEVNEILTEMIATERIIGKPSAETWSNFEFERYHFWLTELETKTRELRRLKGE